MNRTRTVITAALVAAMLAATLVASPAAWADPDWRRATLAVSGMT